MDGWMDRLITVTMLWLIYIYIFFFLDCGLGVVHGVFRGYADGVSDGLGCMITVWDDDEWDEYFNAQ